MSKWNESDYLAHWPMAIPFPYSVKRSTRPVPNSTAVNWPQSQFAPLYNPPGSPSFNPYSYTQNDVELSRREPVYSTKNFYPYARSGVGPGGDTSALPSDLGDPMAAHGKKAKSKQTGLKGILARFLPLAGTKKAPHRREKHVAAPKNEREAKQRIQAAVAAARKHADVQIFRQGGATGLRLTPTQVALIRVRSLLQVLKHQPQTVTVRHHIRKLSRHYGRLMDQRRIEVRRAHQHAAVRPVATRANPGPAFRIGMMATNQAITPGVPAPDHDDIPASILTPEPSHASATGLDLGDGFAYELAPLQASAPYGDLGADCGCGCGGAGDCAKNNEGEGMLVGAGIGAVAAMVILPTFVVAPWVIKQFKPEWSYGKRVAAGFLGGWAAMTAVRMASA